jgi:poly(3-hydroxybutyrate) depolymerase
MHPGIDQSPDEWRRRVRGGATGLYARAPPVSIWHGSDDDRVAQRNFQELVEQWTAVHGIPAIPTRRERTEFLMREVYTDGAFTRVESVLVANLGHAFPIRNDGTSACGQAGDFVISVGVCAAAEISRFWGLRGN